VNRREMLGGASAAWLAMGLDGVAGLAEPAKADELRVGVIGPGSRGQELIRHLLHVPGVRISAICDIYEPRYAQVNRLVGSDVPATKDYRELLERKDLDVIYVATPLAHHAEHVLAALKTNRPVYGEKAMGFTPEQCREIYTAATAPGASPDRTSVSLCAVGADSGGGCEEREDRRADTCLRVLAPQQQLAAAGAEPGPGWAARSSDQLEALPRELRRIGNGAGLTSY
jgi:hypothetical protein